MSSNDEEKEKAVTEEESGKVEDSDSEGADSSEDPSDEESSESESEEKAEDGSDSEDDSDEASDEEEAEEKAEDASESEGESDEDESDEDESDEDESEEEKSEDDSESTDDAEEKAEEETESESDDSDDEESDDAESDDDDSEEKAEDKSDSEEDDDEEESDDEEDSESTDDSEEKAEDDSGSAEDSDESDDEEDIPESERRQSGRKGVKLSRLISSKIVDGDSQRECYLHLVDISEGGLRINSDDPFPEDRLFQLEITLAPFGNELSTKVPKKSFPVKTVWSKSLVGGMVVSGLAFQDLDDEGVEIVAAIMQGASPQGRRMHFRLNRVLGVELGRSEEEQQWLYPLTLDLSVEGMRICLSEPLEVGAKFPIKIFLEFELPTVQAQAEVMWQETMPSGRVQVGLKFEEMSERDAMAVKTYIDQCLRQDEAHRRL